MSPEQEIKALRKILRRTMDEKANLEQRLSDSVRQQEENRKKVDDLKWLRDQFIALVTSSQEEAWRLKRVWKQYIGELPRNEYPFDKSKQ